MASKPFLDAGAHLGVEAAAHLHRPVIAVPEAHVAIAPVAAMLRRQIGNVLVAGGPALSSQGEFVSGQCLGEPNQLRIFLHRCGTGLAGGVCELGSVREADLPVGHCRPGIWNRSELCVGAYVAGRIGAGQAAVLSQQPRPAVAMALTLGDDCGDPGLEHFDAAAELLGHTKGAVQQIAGRRLDLAERCIEMHQRLLHMKEHTFILAGWRHK